MLRRSIITLVLFSFIVLFGYWQASLRALSNDEIFTQYTNIERESYSKIALGLFNEPTRSPLFFLIQKTITDTSKYKIPEKAMRTMIIAEPRGQILLRLQSILFIALTGALLFYYFSLRFGIGWGFFSFLGFFLTPLVWLHVADARPYGLWIFLLVFQALIFYSLLTQGPWGRLKILFIVTLFLSLTSVLGMFQTVIMGTCVWVFGKQRSFRFLLCLVIPLGVAFYYYILARSAYPFELDLSPALLLNSIPFDKVLLISLGSLCVYISTISLEKGIRKISLESRICWGLCVGMLGIALVFGTYTFLISKHPGAPVTTRHFLFILPAGLIAYVVTAREMMVLSKRDSWLKVSALMVIFLTIALGIINIFYVAYRLCSVGYL